MNPFQRRDHTIKVLTGKLAECIDAYTTLKQEADRDGTKQRVEHSGTVNHLHATVERTYLDYLR